MTPHRWTIAFDADDTLWHNERFFRLTQTRFEALLAAYCEGPELHRRLIAAERRNVGRYGFGIKGFVLSMIETALEVSADRVPGSVIRQMVEAGQEMLAHPIELLPGAAEVVRALRGRVDLMIITKGDLLDQERKVAQSGLGELFDAVEVVSDKTADIYGRIFARRGTARAMMIGNSLKSDVIPAIEAGAWGVHVPHELTWELEQAQAPEQHRRFHRIGTLTDLPHLLAGLDQGLAV